MNQETIDKILGIGSRWYQPDSLTDSEKDMMRNAYASETRQTLGNCGSCWATAYLYFTNYKQNKQKQMEKQKSKFVIKAGGQIHCQHAVYTNDNITDEEAIALLKHNKKNIGHFESFPDNWQELLEEPAKPALETTSTEEVKKGKGGKAKKAVSEEPAKPALDDEKKADYESKSIEELKAFASSLELPEEEYTALDKTAMIDYLLEKLSK